MLDPKQITERRIDADAVRTAGVKFGPAIQVGLDAEFGHGVGTTLMAGVDIMLGHAQDNLGAFSDAMISLINERDQQVPLRITRDELTDAQYAEVMRFREFAQSTWGDGVVRHLRLEGRVPNDAKGLYGTVEWILRRVETLELPAGRYGAVVDIQVPLAPLRERHAQMAEVLEKLGDESREAQLALDAKNAAMAKYDETFHTVASLLSILLEAIGKDNLAGRVRPSRTNPGRVSGPLDDLDALDPVTDDAGPTPAAEDAEG